jgi:hypothetical protein
MCRTVSVVLEMASRRPHRALWNILFILCSLYNATVNNLDYVAFRELMKVYNELKRVRKEMVMVQFKIQTAKKPMST